MDLSKSLKIPLFVVATTTITPFLLAKFQNTYYWTVLVAFFLSWLVGFSNGANDVANLFGTSIGSKVIKYWQAYLLATIFEILGAVLVGYNITETLRKGIIDIPDFEGDPEDLLLGTSIFVLIATIFSLPVASSHSIIGSVIGFSVLMRGVQGIYWWKIFEIFISWLVSPFLSGLVSVILYIILDFAVLRKKHPLKCGLRTLPIFYFTIFAFITFTILFQGSKILHLQHIPLWLALVVSLTVGIVAALIFFLFIRPKLKTWVLEKEASIRARIFYSEIHNESQVQVEPFYRPRKKIKVTEKEEPPIPYYTQPKFDKTPKGFIKWFLPARNRNEDHEAEHMFSALQIFSGCLASFAHGAKESAIVISNLAILMSVYHTMNVHQNEPVPLYMFLFGSVSLASGFLFGYKVIRTIGRNMAEIDPCSGFCIEFGMAITTILASKAGLPISTTQCIVGSVAAVGSYKSGKGVQWKLFWYTILAWIVTLPISAILAAIFMLILRYFFS